MAGALQIKQGTKMRVAFDVPANQEPQFNMMSTFNKALDESAFLVSIPMHEGKALIPDENQKMLFRYGEGEESQVIAGYVDDIVKEGIRRFWKVRRVAENRQFVKRVDVRMKVELPITFMQDTWALNSQGEIDKEKGETADISNNGLAVYMNRWFDVGESCRFTLPRIGTVSEGRDAQGRMRRSPVPEKRRRRPSRPCAGRWRRPSNRSAGKRRRRWTMRCAVRKRPSPARRQTL